MIGRGVPRVGERTPEVAANLNPPAEYKWETFAEGGDSYVRDPQNKILSTIQQRKGGHVPSFYRQRGIDAVPAFEGPAFRNPRVARQYAEAVLRSGRFDGSVDPRPFQSEIVSRRLWGMRMCR